MILVDRTRHLAGLEFCPRARYWEYEYGGRGVRPKALSIPPATGKAVHRVIEPLLRNVQATGDYPERKLARDLILAGVEEYRQEATEAGLRNGQAPDSEHPSEEVQYLIKEQCSLVEGLGWAFWRCILPFIQRDFEVVSVEHELNYVLGCTCGLGDGTIGEVKAEKGALTHEGRECGGVALMLRNDLITRQTAGGAVAVWDFKTSASDWTPHELENLVQMALGVVGAGEIAGEACTQHYLVGLHKGQRKADRGQQLKKQQSPFCYLYYLPADPPYGEAQYQAKYTRARGWTRVPVWELEFPRQHETEPGASPVEHWAVDMMKAEEVAEKCSLNGPTQAPIHLIPSVLTEVEAEARYWADIMAAMKEDPAGIDTYVRRSWDCYPYYEPCAYLRICAGDPGLAQDPIGSGRFIWRDPHHTLEIETQGGGE